MSWVLFCFWINTAPFDCDNLIIMIKIDLLARILVVFTISGYWVTDNWNKIRNFGKGWNLHNHVCYYILISTTAVCSAIMDILAWDGTLSLSEFSLAAHTLADKWKRLNPSFPSWSWVACREQPWFGSREVCFIVHFCHSLWFFLFFLSVRVWEV